jgi:hypothetical protein
MDLNDIKGILEQQGEAWQEFKDNHQKEVGQLRKTVQELEARSQRMQLAGDAGEQHGGPAYWLETDKGERLPALTKSQRVAEHLPDTVRDEQGPSLGQWVRDQVRGTKAVGSSTATVPTYVGAQIIDDVRALTTVIQAGAVTIAIDGPTNLAKITGDPTVYVHTENAGDVNESDVTIAPVSLNPKTLMAIVPVSLEVVEDSANLDAILRTSLAAAFALKLDTTSLATLVADAAIPKNALPGTPLDPAVWADCLSGVGLALGQNQPLPAAMISNAADFIARAKETAVGSGNWLGKAPVLAGMQELFTTSLAAGTAFYGGFTRGFAVALRADLTMQLVRHANPTSGQHRLVAYMRAGGYVLQPKALFKQLKA